MYQSVYDLKSFYSTRAGRLVRRLLSGHIREIWPDLSGKRLMGYGYAVPFLRPLKKDAERVVAIMPARGGVHHWPDGERGLVCLGSADALPLEAESLDRILIVHAFDQSESLDILLQECWRVLKSNGRLLMIVPNRLGLWARVDWTPFGHGVPYTAGQINHHLQANLFAHERTEKALFMPPFKSFLVMRTAYFFESFGKFIFPGLAGVSLVEASKQVYAGVPRGKAERRRAVLITDPVAAG